MVDDVSARPHAAGLLDVVGGDRKNRTPVYGLGGEDALFASRAESGFAGRFGHADNIKHGFRLPAFGSR
jgi:hypothetical protein